MIQTCPNCGYVTTHIKHYMGCNIPKNQWPSEYLHSVGETASGRTIGVQPMPAVSVKVVDQTGIREITVISQAAATIAPVAPTSLAVVDGEDEVRSMSDGSVSPVQASASLQGGACCKHPEQMHVRDAEGFPPTCMGCPDGADEHEWLPDTLTIVTVPGITSASDYSRTINSPRNVMCECGFLAKSEGTLRTHRAKAKLHKTPVTSA